MDLRHLRYFQAVAEQLSFSKAAQKLRVAQPALSRAVMELEAELEAQLLLRTRRSVKLTAAGAVMLREAGLLLGLCEEAVRKVQRTARGQEGELRLGFIGPPTKSFLARLLKEFGRLHPKVTVQLEERTPERVWEMVSKDRLDIGITRPVAGGERIGLSTLPLRKEAMCAVLLKDHPLAKVKKLEWKQLRGESLVVLARREGVGLHDQMLIGCHEAGFSPKIAHTPSVIGTVLTYVEAGAGVGVVPETVETLSGRADLVFKPLHPLLEADLVMVWSPQQSNPAAGAFRAVTVDWLAKNEVG
ncbi:LysR family transcriptional regulator [Phragmitibacter flavus]|uniref:LysR family transcriptional regulator n=1 Tax=Phragmitibacter flavus TaxID=2576071 RepID=A0A5R8KJN3_9BACT|nr:LysR substrate-binding domain-containing protein [Phragmitibacter flavus]TLD72533.1 LysR family transcriptional regulator [Phragmitibacter flavus]